MGNGDVQFRLGEIRCEEVERCEHGFKQRLALHKFTSQHETGVAVFMYTVSQKRH